MAKTPLDEKLDRLGPLATSLFESTRRLIGAKRTLENEVGNQTARADQAENENRGLTTQAADAHAANARAESELETILTEGENLLKEVEAALKKS